MSIRTLLITLILITPSAWALKYDPAEAAWNLNQNQNATDPLDYSGSWQNHVYNPSPSNWRMPFYTLMLDRFVNGNPTNDDANGTQFEFDHTQTQLRHGGDIQGLRDSLDYLQGMGIKALYLAGSPHINVPWASDSYSPLDLTLLDHHFGNITEWQSAIAEIHRRGMYVVLDNTMATMGDLIGFEGYLNTSTPFRAGEHNALWKTDRHYTDFNFGNDELPKCTYPRFYDDFGNEVTNLTSELVGCRDSEFNQYGEVAAFGDYPEWERQISKFAFVQDRLREWRSDVRVKIEHFSCLTISMLDIDGFRIDKGLTVTVDAQAEWSKAMRECARKHNKDNFYISGEIVAGNTFGSVYIGRGRSPDQVVENVTQAITMTNTSDSKYFIRDAGLNALDGAAFHYTVYRSLNRFLGMDGTYEAAGDPPTDWVDFWKVISQTNDMINANTGVFDPRHMYGVTNQDVFRWPSITNGTEKQLLGFFVITFLLPGIPTLVWGEEQAFYLLDSTASNYVFGRSPVSSSQAWGMHGCYKVGNAKYTNFPLDAAIYGCEDESVLLDHRDPSSGVRNIIKSSFEMRANYPVLNDGFSVNFLSKQTHDIHLPGSKKTPTETGMWSVSRSGFSGVQDFNQSIWLVYQNENQTTNFTFDCHDVNSALVAPFPAKTIVQNLFFPFEELVLEKSTVKQDNITGASNGCLSSLEIPAWGFKAFVPKTQFIAPSPVITKFLPGHDYRLLSSPGNESVPIELHFSAPMDCDQITKGLKAKSTVADDRTAQLDKNSVQCKNASNADPSPWVGGVNTTWIFTANLVNVADGIHQLTLDNITSADGGSSMNSVDHFLVRKGDTENPMVFPKQANYSTSLLHQDDKKNLYISHSAPGADKFRYSLNFGTTYSDWEGYKGGANATLAPKVWSGTDLQNWKGEHVIVQYWSRFAGSSSHFQQGDLNLPADSPPRRFPHLFLHGPFNQYGFDAGLPSEMKIDSDGLWKFNFMQEWPAEVSLNMWGMNPDGRPDQTKVYGDIDGDNILDRIPPESLITNTINITDTPPSPFLAFQIALNDGDLRYQLIPVGSRWTQLALYILLWCVPIITGVAGVWAFKKSFYQVKFNPIGIIEKKPMIPLAIRRKLRHFGPTLRIEPPGKSHEGDEDIVYHPQPTSDPTALTPMTPLATIAGLSFQAPPAAKDPGRRTVLIATMEYDIEDWAIKIKIGGLGVMAQLMGKNLAHQDLIWVVPCVGDVDYPIDQRAENMRITVLGGVYDIQVQYHVLRNITYVLLDAPVFRQQTKSEPYPPRMDDLDSAVYYSAWNSCIAEAMKRFPVDLYHINDYHGAVAPLHLLPRVIPCALSLHNAEFQGLWPMRTVQEHEEVCQVYNLDPAIVRKYVQFGEVFNLLHAAASYLRVHQKGFGAVGVSAKYGKRSYARYPILWGLKEVGSLPNPDPTDTAPWNKEQVKTEDIHVDAELEAAKPELKRQAQEWAGLNQDPNADLFVFVGRWSQQKGVDLIADVFPSVLEANPQVQLACVGPMIDLYGKFAALKLSRMMEVYPGRVFSKPEFTALPPYMFSGADFALMPSRDEPFGLVAVEFGRKGALCVGARVGGLGQMPGWWFTIESTTTKHVMQQFKIAIQGALNSKPDVRAIMRARAAKQRFPVAQWIEDLEKLQTTAIDINHRIEQKKIKHGGKSAPGTPIGSRFNTPAHSRSGSLAPSRNPSRPASPELEEPPSKNGGLGSRLGPGYRNKRLSKSTVSSPVQDSAFSDYEDSSDEEDRPQARGRNHSRKTSRSTITRPPIPRIPTYAREHLPSFAPAFSPQGHDHGPSINSSGPFDPYSPSTPETPLSDDWLMRPRPPGLMNHSNASLLSLEDVKGEHTDYKLQQVSPFFTDPKKEYIGVFEDKLKKLDGKNSEDQLCIEEYLVKSEKIWFGKLRDAEMGKTPGASPAPSVYRLKPGASPNGSIFEGRSMHDPTPRHSYRDDEPIVDEFLLGDNYAPPTGLKHILRLKVGDWPIYAILLGFGQIIAANSYQITLLSGQVGEPASKLYVVASIYLVASISWWLLYRRFKPVYILAAPFAVYGLAFFLIAMAPLGSSFSARGWIQNVATGLYAVASASGSIYFAVNFGDEGGAPVTVWTYRACIIQGTQQIYVVALWYWGSQLTRSTAETGNAAAAASPKVIIPVGIAAACLMWAVGTALFIGLPKYYRQAPGKVPSFYMSLFRRKIILWFFIVVVIQNYFLSAPYGRNWLYLWSSQHVPTYGIALLVILFFIGVWAAFLYLFARLSTSHSWILPVFAMGLGAPRWAQILWGTSGIGQYVPWAGGPVASAVAGRSLWLWLGVLDALQGVGFGMILLQTLTRFHVLFTLIAAQVLGSIATILARATAPDKIGPGDVFPDFSAGAMPGLGKGWFWVALLFNLGVPVGFFMFFRKEQLSKP